MKKLLALVLALVMSMSLVTISNAAFSDADKIDHTEAVEVMNALGVINGMPDGSFNPSGTVTRAEMAKMISIIMLGDIDAAAFVGTTTDLKDINGHWAEGYIKYCYSQGVIAGRGDGTFAPNANVTAVEAAKMLCVAIGYNATVQGYVGGDWAINIIRDAQLSKLFDDLSVASTKVLTRDEAAQMIYNAINAKMIEKKPSISITNGNITYSYEQSDSKTLLSETFGAKTFIGTLKGNDKTVNACNKGEVQVFGKLDTENSGDRNAQFPSAISLSNIGEEVKVIYKEGKGGIDKQPDKKDTIYGVYNTGNTTVYNLTKADIQDVDAANNKIKFGDTKYEFVPDVGRNTSITTNLGGVAAKALNAANLAAMKVDSADTIKFVTNSDGKIAAAYVIEKAFAKVAAVNKDNVQLTTFGKMSFKDDVIYDGIAKDDIVMVTKLYDTAAADATYVVEKAEIVTGKVDKFFNGTKISVGGTTYSMSANHTAVGDYTDANTTALTNGALGNDYELIVYGKQFIAYKSITEAYGNYAVILAANDGDDINGQSVKLLTADGSKVTYKISDESAVGSGALAYYKTTPATDLDHSTGLGTLVEYKVLNDGSVKMNAATTAAASNKGSYNKDTKSLTYGATTLTSTDAVAFVLYNSEWKVMKASAIGASITGTTKDVQYKLNSAGDRVVAFAIQATAAVSSSTSDYKYMYITGYANSYKDSKDNTYTDVSGITAGGEAVTLTFEDDQTTDAKLARNTFIRYKEGADGKVALTDVTQVTSFGRVAEYDEARKLIVISGTTYPVAKDAVIINVDTDKKAAGSMTGISEADPVNVTYQNVAFITDTVDGVANTITAIFVDDNLQMKTAGVVSVTAPAGATAADVKALDDGTYTPADDTFATSNSQRIAGTAEDNRIFKFTAPTTQNYTLTVKNSDGTQVYTETASGLSAGAHYFFITLNPVQNNAGTVDGTVWSTGAAAAGTYTYEIKGADNTVVLNGTFFA